MLASPCGPCSCPKAKYKEVPAATTSKDGSLGSMTRIDFAPVTKFLKEKLKYYFRQDYKNVLVILTDGDEAFNSDIQKSRTKIDLNGNYTGLKIFMCGINAPNSSKNQNEISEIRKNWITKFQQIGINEDDIEFNEVNDINLIETKVKQFVNVN